MAQGEQQEGKASSRSDQQILPSDPIGCYLPLLLMGFTFSFGAYVYIAMYLPIFRAFSASGEAGVVDLVGKLLIALHIPLGALFSWMLSGVIICLSLLLWFKLLTWFELRRAQIIFAVVVGVAIIWWIGGLVGHLEGAEPDSLFQFMVGALLRVFLMILGIPIERVMPLISPFSVVILALGVLVLPVLWCRRSTFGPVVLPTWFVLGFWLLWCLALMWGMGEWRVGIELLVSMATGTLFFVVGLRPASGSLLPLPGRDHWGKTLGFLRDWAVGYNYPAYVVVDELYEEDRVEERVHGNRFRELGDAPGFIISDCNYAVAVSSNTQFKGVQGPGVVFTGYADQVVQIVDLRPQLRAFPVEAMTKDGIQITTTIFAPCKIDSRGKQPRLGESLPYSPAAGSKAIRSQEMRHEGLGQTPDRQEKYRWEDLTRLIATRILQDIVSRYEFDDLYGPYQPGGDPPRKVIAQELVGRLRNELKKVGIALVGGGISELQPVDSDVYVKRVQNWKVEWGRKIALQKAEGQAEWLQMVERARAEAQAELILNLGRQLEELSTARAEFRPQAALSLFVGILEELMTRRPTLEKEVPVETLEALLNIRRAIE
jgi:regulator of protease activity HflC (stomatin/prohibitin superfamily)